MSGEPSERDREAALVTLNATLSWAEGEPPSSKEIDDALAKVAAAITRARLEGDAAGYARGLEDAAAWFDKHYPNSNHNGSNNDAVPDKGPPLTFGNAVRAIVVRAGEGE